MIKLDSKYKEDLMFMIKKYEETFIAPYYCFSKNELLNYISEYLSKTTIENDLQFLCFLKTILKKLNGVLDCHTTVRTKRSFLPFYLKMFNDGIYIIKTSKENQELLYSKLESINGILYQELIKRLENVISYSTEEWRKSCIEIELTELNSLLSILENNDKDQKINMIFTTLNGEQTSLVFGEDENNEDVVLAEENCTFKVFDNTIHYIYNSCSKEDENKILETLKQLKGIISNQNIKCFILDLRDNSGGSSSVIKPLIEFLKTQKMELYAFVNRNTFSSGMFALENMVKLGATTIGEGVGSTINGFGNLDAVFELPNTKFAFRVATKYFPKDGGAITSQEEFRRHITENDLKPVYYIPDIIVNENIEDYKLGRDIYLESFTKLKNRDTGEHDK